MHKETYQGINPEVGNSQLSSIYDGVTEGVTKSAKLYFRFELLKVSLEKTQRLSYTPAMTERSIC
jgi:hypothetical protein